MILDVAELIFFQESPKTYYKNIKKVLQGVF